MTHWDIYIVDPIIFLIGLISIAVIFYLERIRGKVLLFYIETIMIWIANAVLTKLMARSISSAMGLSVSDTTFTLMLIFACTLIAFALKPVATWFTGKIHNRRLWMWIGYITTFIALVLALFNKNGENLGIYFGSFILVGFSMSTSSLYYLFSNEQHYYRINAMGVGFMVAICIAFSTFLGGSLISVADAFTNSKVYYFIIAFALALTITAFFLGFIKKERSRLINAFEPEVLSTLKITKTSTIVLIVFIAFLLSLAQQFTHGIFSKMFITILLCYEGIKQADIKNTIALLDYLPTILIVALGYFSYRFALRNLGIKFYNFICIFFAVVCVVIQAFAKEGFLIIVLGVISSFCFSQILYALFATAIFQNYRRHGVPVTGYVAGAIQAGIFLDDFIENILIKNKVSIFDKYNTINSIINNYDAANYQKDFDNFNTFFTAVSSIAVCVALISILILYFRADDMFVEYLDFKQLTILQKNNLRKMVIDRAKTPVDMGH